MSILHEIGRELQHFCEVCLWIRAPSSWSNEMRLHRRIMAVSSVGQPRRALLPPPPRTRRRGQRQDQSQTPAPPAHLNRSQSIPSDGPRDDRLVSVLPGRGQPRLVTNGGWVAAGAPTSTSRTTPHRAATTRLGTPAPKSQVYSWPHGCFILRCLGPKTLTVTLYAMAATAAAANQDHRLIDGGPVGSAVVGGRLRRRCRHRTPTPR